MVLAAMKAHLKFIDLFCGIGGFRVAGDSLGWQCVFSCDIDLDCRRAYAANFGDVPRGDIHDVTNSTLATILSKQESCAHLQARRTNLSAGVA